MGSNSSRIKDANIVTALYDKWNQWIVEIGFDIFVLIGGRNILRGMTIVMDTNPSLPKPNAFLGWIDYIYYQSTTVAVRRLIDSSPDVISFPRLLNDMARHHADIVVPTAAPGTKIPIRAEIEGDLIILRKSADTIKHEVDKVIAHHTNFTKPYIDSGARVADSTIDDALDHMADLYTKYCLVITGTHWEPEVECLSLHPNWLEIFRTSWITDESIEMCRLLLADKSLNEGLKHFRHHLEEITK